MVNIVPKIISQLLCAHKWKHTGQQFEKIAPKKFILRDKDECTKCPKKRLIPIKDTGDK